MTSPEVSPEDRHLLHKLDLMDITCSWLQDKDAVKYGFVGPASDSFTPLNSDLGGFVYTLKEVRAQRNTQT